MVCGVSVGAINTCGLIVSDGMGVTAVSLLYHCTVGVGLPSATQYNVARPPTLIM